MIDSGTPGVLLMSRNYSLIAYCGGVLLLLKSVAAGRWEYRRIGAVTSFWGQ